MASLAAELETVGELAAVVAGFIKLESDSSPFAFFVSHKNFEPYDAGVIVVDLAARGVAVDSSYSMPSALGKVRVQSNASDEDVLVSYRLSYDWLFVYSVPAYEGVCGK